MKVNQNCDFDFLFKIFLADDSEVGIPLLDWNALFFVGDQTNQGLTVKRACGKYVGCFEDNGRIHVIADHHSLPRGKVQCRFEMDIPDENFPDGTRHLSALCPTDIEITKDASEDNGTFETSITLPTPFSTMSYTPAPDPIDPLAILTDIAAGKAKIAAALRDKGIECADDESFDALAQKIADIVVADTTAEDGKIDETQE